MTSNLYKVGDWVYCEVSSFQPYVVRKIEELTKTPNGNVEAKVICAYRYQDIPAPVMATVEKYQQKSKEAAAAESSNSNTDTQNSNTNNTNSNQTQNDYYEEREVSDLNELQRYNLRHRELFFSKCTETIAATAIRAKCSVLLFNEEVERYSEYLNKDDQFYYHLTYDPSQKSLVADKGEIRVGSRYQAEIPQLKITPNGTIVEDNSNESLSQPIVTNDRVLRSQLQRMNSQKETPVPEIPILQQTEEQFQWCPLNTEILNYSNQLTDREIDQFLVLAKSVGTFARALDCNNAFKQPSLPLSAAAASRDITLFHAMNALHDNNYDVGKAALSLITSSGPVLCKDELEDWSAVEANLFEDALEKYGKDFNEIKKDYLPWKTMRSLIEYYYQWKTTDRYIQQKRIKTAEQESKLKQVYIPNHSKQNQSTLIKSSHVQTFNQYDVHLKNSCESCGAPNTSTNQWYAYNPTSLVQCIMSGQTNPTVLANAQAQSIAALQASNPNSNSTHINQARVCSECWIYYKKFSAFKYPNAKYERLAQMKNQMHKCSVNGCGREFKMKQQLIKHCGIAHGYFAKTNNPPGQNDRPPAIRNRTAFYLQTTPMTKAARHVCTNTVKLKKLAKKPFKLVELAELNKEWSKETRNIAQIIEESKKKTIKKSVLDVKLISVISKNRAKIVKRKGANAKKGDNAVLNGNNGTNGHVSEDDENSNDLIIDHDMSTDGDKPEYLKYFEQKCTTPCYVPENIVFVKPTSEQINKFHLNLMSQSRKRPHDQANGTSNAGNSDGSSLTSASSNVNQKTQNGTENDSNDSSPQSKRSLLSSNRLLSDKQLNNNSSINNNINKISNNLNNQQNSAQQLANNNNNNNTNNNNNNNNTNNSNSKLQARLAQKSIKPTQSINLPNSPEDIYYVAIPNLKALRRDLESVTIRKLARKPHRLLAEQYQNLYQTLEKICTESMAKYAKFETKKQNGDGTVSVDLNNETSNDTLENGECKKESLSSSSSVSSSNDIKNGLKSNKISNSNINNKNDDDIVEVEVAKNENSQDQMETNNSNNNNNIPNSSVVVLD